MKEMIKIDTSYCKSKSSINVNKNVNMFKTGQSNILLATSVIEEGFDVSTCNTVISFDFITTEKSFIQLKGRARKLNSEFIILSEKNFESLYKKQIDSYVNNYKTLKNMGINPDKINSCIMDQNNLKINLIPDVKKFKISKYLHNNLIFRKFRSLTDLE